MSRNLIILQTDDSVKLDQKGLDSLYDRLKTRLPSDVSILILPSELRYMDRMEVESRPGDFAAAIEGGINPSAAFEVMPDGVKSDQFGYQPLFGPQHQK